MGNGKSFANDVKSLAYSYLCARIIPVSEVNNPPVTPEVGIQYYFRWTRKHAYCSYAMNCTSITTAIMWRMLLSSLTRSSTS